MLEEMVKAVVNKVIAQDYPFLKTPAALYAVVTKAARLGETFDYKDLVIHNDETGTSYRGHITAHWYEYTLQVVDRWGKVDESFPARRSRARSNRPSIRVPLCKGRSTRCRRGLPQ